MNKNTYAMLLHLSTFLNSFIPLSGIVVKLVLWSSKKDEEGEFIEEHAKEAINFEISMFIYVTIAIVLCIIFIGFILLLALSIYILVVVIMASIAANNGEKYQYPMVFRFVK